MNMHKKKDNQEKYKLLVMEMLTCCQKTASKTHPPQPHAPCMSHPESIPLETRPSAPTACDWTARTVWWDSSWEKRTQYTFSGTETKIAVFFPQASWHLVFSCKHYKSYKPDAKALQHLNLQKDHISKVWKPWSVILWCCFSTKKQFTLLWWQH